MSEQNKAIDMINCQLDNNCSLEANFSFLKKAFEGFIVTTQNTTLDDECKSDNEYAPDGIAYNSFEIGVDMANAILGVSQQPTKTDDPDPDPDVDVTIECDDRMTDDEVKEHIINSTGMRHAILDKRRSMIGVESSNSDIIKIDNDYYLIVNICSTCYFCNISEMRVEENRIIERVISYTVRFESIIPNAKNKIQRLCRYYFDIVGYYPTEYEPELNIK